MAKLYNDTDCVFQICTVLGLPPDTPTHQVVAKVRETKAAADLAGEALQLKAECGADIMARGHFAPAGDQDNDLPIGPRRDLTGTRDHRIA